MMCGQLSPPTQITPAAFLRTDVSFSFSSSVVLRREEKCPQSLVSGQLFAIRCRCLEAQTFQTRIFILFIPCADILRGATFADTLKIEAQSHKSRRRHSNNLWSIQGHSLPPLIMQMTRQGSSPVVCRHAAVANWLPTELYGN